MRGRGEARPCKRAISLLSPFFALRGLWRLQNVQEAKAGCERAVGRGEDDRRGGGGGGGVRRDEGRKRRERQMNQETARAGRRGANERKRNRESESELERGEEREREKQRDRERTSERRDRRGERQGAKGKAGVGRVQRPGRGRHLRAIIIIARHNSAGLSTSAGTDWAIEGPPEQDDGWKGRAARGHLLEGDYRLCSALLRGGGCRGGPGKGAGSRTIKRFRREEPRCPPLKESHRTTHKFISNLYITGHYLNPSGVRIARVYSSYSAGVADPRSSLGVGRDGSPRRDPFPESIRRKG